jgi:hypothetical protein
MGRIGHLIPLRRAQLYIDEISGRIARYTATLYVF